MTPFEEAPEQRWRRTVDRRDRPAKLKVDRLLRDFGYAELDAEVGDAIEARLAGVSLAVAPSLRHAVADEVVTIYASDSAAPADGPGADAAGAGGSPPGEEPAAASDVAQMVSYLKQQVLDARAEAERLRTELDRRIAARMDAERENEAIIAEQAAALEAQSRQLAELGAALNSTRQALAETRDEIRRAVGELQALPEPVAAEVESMALAADDAAGEVEDAAPDVGLSGEEWADGREEAEAAALAAEAAADEGPVAGVEELAAPAPAPAFGQDAEVDPDEPALAAEPPAPDREPQDPALVLDEPALGASVAAVPDDAFDLDEPALGATAPPVAPEPALELDGPALGEPPVAEMPDASLDLDEPASVVGEVPLRAQQATAPGDSGPGADDLARDADDFDLETPPRGAGAPALEPFDDWQPEIPAEPREPETRLHAVSDPAEHVGAPPADPDRVDDLDAPLPPADDWLPADLRSPSAGASAADPPPGGAGEAEVDDVTDFDDFLYDPDELYDPEQERAAGNDAPLEAEIEARWPDHPPLESEIEARWADESAAALPPPPPAPPSPFAGELDPQPPAVAARPTRGKVLRGRGGRARGRWEGHCSICGREPQVNRRKDLEAAGWDLDDDAAACPQCRGVG